MSIREAIEQARSEYHVYFLLTAYIENLHHSDCASVLPAHLTALPLNGVSDLKQRHDVLGVVIAMLFQDVRSAEGVIRDAHVLFGAALQRLRLLRGTHKRISEAA
jgi:hypothetical protein